MYVQLFCGARDINVRPEVLSMAKLFVNFLCANREGSEYICTGLSGELVLIGE